MDTSECIDSPDWILFIREHLHHEVLYKCRELVRPHSLPDLPHQRQLVGHIVDGDEMTGARLSGDDGVEVSSGVVQTGGTLATLL